MKSLTVISGKGGTGKTTVSASLAYLYKNLVVADCDVDAADLHLLLHPLVKQKNYFFSGRLAEINKAKCINCGKCEDICRFDSVKITEAGSYEIIKHECEGCGLCVRFCPAEAISFNERYCGEWYDSETEFCHMVHAALDIGAENSGRLVTLVREEAKKKAIEEDIPLVLIDGAPGIGCPVIASITGADAVLVVTEPTFSGIHDLERILMLTSHFKIRTLVAINKFDISKKNTELIKQKIIENKAVFAGVISYSDIPVKAMKKSETLIEYDPTSPISAEIVSIKCQIDKVLFPNGIDKEMN